jgi:surface protein
VHLLTGEQKKMADDHFTPAAGLPSDEEKNDVGGDIEQGRIDVSETTDVLSSSLATTTTPSTMTSWPLDGLEHVDEEDVAPVLLIQQIADVGIEKDDTNTKNAAPSGHASMVAQDAMEQIEGDDAAPRPFNSSEFEDESSKPKIELCQESSDEDDEPPLPLTLSDERDSLSDAKKMAATPQASSSNSRSDAPDAAPSFGGNVVVGGDPTVQQMDEHQSAAGDEDDIRRRVVGPENHSANANVRGRPVLSEVERTTSVHILEAYLVDEWSDDGANDTVYEATPLVPELPWWNQMRTKILLVIICALFTASAAGLGVAFTRPTAVYYTAAPISTNATPTTAPIVKTGDSPAVIFSPSQSPAKPSYRCFDDREELKKIIQFVASGCGAPGADTVFDFTVPLCTGVSDRYGWPMGSWCIENITDMSSLFEGLDTFNENISGWNVGQVTTMRSMFAGASSFHQDLSVWDTSSVTTMSAMFSGASVFNGNISSWDTSAVTDMSRMFAGASSFNPDDLFNWDTSAVTTMKDMFTGASAFNGNIKSWDTSAVTDISGMFYGASSFHQDLSLWDTSSVTTMSAMFDGASVFNGNISSWDTSAVTDMSGMFYEASAFNGNISYWTTSAVIDMSAMFLRALSFNPDDLSNWDTSSVTDMSYMFKSASAFNGNISSWNMSAVTSMYGMLYNASSFNQNLCAWKDTFPYNYADDIFVNSGCAVNGDPVSATQGPFCASSCTNL